MVTPHFLSEDYSLVITVLEKKKYLNSGKRETSAIGLSSYLFTGLPRHEMPGPYVVNE